MGITEVACIYTVQCICTFSFTINKMLPSFIECKCWNQLKQFLQTDTKCWQVRCHYPKTLFVFQWTTWINHTALQNGNLARILHLTVCMKITDASDPLPKVLTEPQPRRDNVCVNGKAQVVEQGCVGLMVLTVWQLNRSFTHQIKEKSPTLQTTEQHYRTKQQYCGSRKCLQHLIWGKNFDLWKSM